ncbi:MAG: ATP-grasp domain-containing protein [Promethearchaeota archaeon]
MAKKIVFSARQDHEVIKLVTDKISKIQNIEVVVHDPTKEFFNLTNMPDSFKDIDLMIVKVRNECSVDLLHYAKIHKIPTFHDVDTVLMCKNKIALDFALRNAIGVHPQLLKRFLMPDSWIQSLKDINTFKKWALPKLPFVIKSHYQHDKYNRFNFLVQKVEDIDIFCERYKTFLYYNVYIQKFIECDGIERKIYVIGNKVFGIKRENPIYVYLREKPENINVDMLEREVFEVSDDIRNLAKILSEELNLKIFGFDLVRPISQDELFLIDLNDFPGFKGIPNVVKELADYLRSYILAF